MRRVALTVLNERRHKATQSGQVGLPSSLITREDVVEQGKQVHMVRRNSDLVAIRFRPRLTQASAVQVFARVRFSNVRSKEGRDVASGLLHGAQPGRVASTALQQPVTRGCVSHDAFESRISRYVAEPVRMRIAVASILKAQPELERRLRLRRDDLTHEQPHLELDAQRVDKCNDIRILAYPRGGVTSLAAPVGEASSFYRDAVRRRIT
jgi:hypothetical protein